LFPVKIIFKRPIFCQLDCGKDWPIGIAKHSKPGAATRPVFGY
jgi:hypothetical protein